MLPQLRLEFVSALARPLNIGARFVAFRRQPLSAVAMLGGLRGGDLDERSEVGGVGGAPFGVLLQLRLELVDAPVGLLRGGARCVAFRGESVGVVCCCSLSGRRPVARFSDVRLGLVEFALEAVSPVAVLGGFGGGDVDEGLQVGRRGRGLLRLLGEFALEPLHLGCPLSRGRLSICAARVSGIDVVASGLELGFELRGSLPKARGLGARGVDQRLEFGGRRGRVLRCAVELGT